MFAISLAIVAVVATVIAVMMNIADSKKEKAETVALKGVGDAIPSPVSHRPAA